MECTEFLRRYSDYDDSLVPTAEAERFREHMAVCPACARYDRVLRKGRMLARQLDGPEPAPDFIPRLRLRLLEHRRTRTRGWPRARLAAGLAAATVLLVAVTALGLMPDTIPSTGTADSTPVVAPRFPVEASPRYWTARRVARGGGGAYSPLVTGPPVYRAISLHPSGTQTLD